MINDEKIYEFIFDEIAQEELYDIFDYYKKNANDKVAQKFFNKIQTITEALTMWPESGRKFSDELPIRSAKIPGFPYRIYYRIDDFELYIIGLSVYHSKRDLDKLIPKLRARLAKE